MPETLSHRHTMLDCLADMEIAGHVDSAAIVGRLSYEAQKQKKKQAKQIVTKLLRDYMNELMELSEDHSFTTLIKDTWNVHNEWVSKK